MSSARCCCEGDDDHPRHGVDKWAARGRLPCPESLAKSSRISRFAGRFQWEHAVDVRAETIWENVQIDNAAPHG